MVAALTDEWLVPQGFRSASPRDSARRGAHVSINRPDAREVCARLIEAGVLVDFRTPATIRLGLSPLPTSFAEVWDAVDRMRQLTAVTDVAANLDRVGPKASASSVLPPDRAGSPGSLIVSFAGSYLRQLGGWIARRGPGRLPRCGRRARPRPCDRRCVRLKSRGFLSAERLGRRRRLRLTEAGLHDLATGDRRIFRYGGGRVRRLGARGVLRARIRPAPSAPAAHRAVLARFRHREPGRVDRPDRPLAEPTRELLARRRAGRVRHLVHRGQRDGGTRRAMVDLDALDADYRRFLADHRALLDRPTVDDENAFRRYVLLVDAWRRFPRLDPGLPARLLPADWPARAAWDTFSTLHGRWHHRGLAHVGSIVAARAANGPSGDQAVG